MVITWPCTGRRVTKHEESHLRGVTPRKNDLAVIARRKGWRLARAFVRHDHTGIPHCSERNGSPWTRGGSGRRGNGDVSGQKCIAQRGSRRVKGESVPTSRRGGREGGRGRSVVAAVASTVEEVDGGGEGEGKEPRRGHTLLPYRESGLLCPVHGESQSQYLRFLPTVDGDHLFPGA